MRGGVIIQMETVRVFWEWLRFDMHGGANIEMETALGLGNG